MSYRSDVEKAVNDVRIVDTHEHLMDIRFDLRTLLRRSYAWWAFTGSGHTTSTKYKSEFENLPDDEWWERALACLAVASNTAFVKHLLIAFRDLYGFNEFDLTRSRIDELAEKVRAAYTDPGWYDRVVTRKANVDIILHDKHWVVGDTSESRPYLKPVIRLDSFLCGYSRSARDHDNNTPYSFADRIGFTVRNFDDYLGLLDKLFALGAGGGEDGPAARKAVALKIASAYDRSLFFSNPSISEAREAFDRLYCEDGNANAELVTKFQDYTVRYAVGKAVEYDLPVQIHTGLGRIESSNPVHLHSLIGDYPDAKFDLFHGGYPWISESAALAMSYENVYLDLCWLPVISPSAARRALSEWLEVVPQNRILWGGDTWSPEGVYGAVQLGRQTITEVLHRKVAEGYLSLSQAVEIAGRILRENALELYPEVQEQVSP